MSRRLWHVGEVSAVIVVVSFVLAGCAPSAGVPETGGISVTATDFAFSEDSWTVPAGEQVGMTFTNNGSVEHEWVIIKAGETVSLPFDDDDEAKVYWEVEAEPGQTTTSTFTAPSEPGTYTVVCGVEGHLEAGMQASLIVQ